MMKKLWYRRFLGAALLTVALGLTACGPEGAKTTQEEESAAAELQAEEKQEQVSFLTGLPVSKSVQNSRPLAVMFNNIEAGTPQAGIGQAAIVYEAPVEGRITRLMGIFEDYSDLERIGSIRSSRDYFVYFALEYDAYYAHFGQATPYVGQLLNSDKVDNLSGAVAGIDKPAPNTFFRSSDRKAPHNVYLTPGGVKKDIEKFQYRTDLREDYQTKFVFASPEEPVVYTEGKEATILYPGGKADNKSNGFSKVQARFEYNEEDGLYYRYEYGDKQIDELTGEQLAYTNVIFQYCHGGVRDENDYLAFACHGKGYKVQVFSGGRMVEGTWEREADELPARYLDENGEPITINPGKTWICVVWDEYGEDVVIE